MSDTITATQGQTSLRSIIESAAESNGHPAMTTSPMELAKAPNLDFTAIAAAALDRADALVPEWLPDGQRHGPEWLCRNPTRDDAKPGSFSVNLTTGKWGDFATEAKGGDLISLLAYLDGTKQGEAARKLREIVSPSSFSQGTQRTGGTGLNGKEFSGSLTVPSVSEPGNRADLPPIPRHAQDKRPAAHRTHGMLARTTEKARTGTGGGHHPRQVFRFPRQVPAPIAPPGALQPGAMMPAPGPSAHHPTSSTGASRGA